MKINLLKIIISIIFVAMVIIGIYKVLVNKNNTSYSSNYDIAVIETTGQLENTSISFYDENIKKVNSMVLPYGGISSYFYNPIISDGKMYCLPEGIFSKKDLGIALSIDLKSGKKDIYNLDLVAPNALTVGEKYFFATNTLNGNTTITRVDKTSKKVKKKIIPKEYVMGLNNTNIDGKDYLIGFSQYTNKNETKSKIYIFDNDMNIKDTLDISKSGLEQYKSFVTEDGVIYFGNLIDSKNNPTDILTRYDMKSRTIENISLGENYLGDIKKYKNLLLIAHCDLATGEGNKITVYDLEKKEKKLIQLDHNIIQMEIKDDTLYCLDGKNIWKYKINNKNFKYVDNNNIKIINKSNVHYYPSSFFINKK